MVSTTVVIGALVGIGLVGLIVFLAMRNTSGQKGAPGRITVVSGPRQGEQIELLPGRTRIGALEDNDIVIPSKQVSRYHAELRVRAGRVHIWDLQARNQTYVNGKSVKTCELQTGDIITVGDAELRYDR